MLPPVGDFYRVPQRGDRAIDPERFEKIVRIYPDWVAVKGADVALMYLALEHDGERSSPTDHRGSAVTRRNRWDY